MTDLRELYQEVILDHNKKPRNFGRLEDPDREAQGDNPLCGDNYTVTCHIDEDGTVGGIAFDGDGCAISKAAASMMTQHVEGKSVEEAESLIDAFRELLTGERNGEEDERLRHLKVFQSVSSRPERIKCAVLPWHTLRAAFKGKQETSTEGDADPFEGDVDPEEVDPTNDATL
jgi:nitrogen fixation NifU-like protein